MGKDIVEKIDGALPQLWQSAKQTLFQPTPREKVKQREGRAGQNYDYVELMYVVDQLNKAFGPFWSDTVEVVSSEAMMRQTMQIVVKVELSVTYPNGVKVIKTGFGGTDVKCYKETRDPVDIGNDFKGAHADGLKKAASKLGIAEDVYRKHDESLAAPENRLEAGRRGAPAQYSRPAQQGQQSPPAQQGDKPKPRNPDAAATDKQLAFLDGMIEKRKLDISALKVRCRAQGIDLDNLTMGQVDPVLTLIKAPDAMKLQPEGSEEAPPDEETF